MKGTQLMKKNKKYEKESPASSGTQTQDLEKIMCVL